ncbi:putative chitinase [Sodalis ligni]|uniref:Putative chitinase n=1 Tax=Sodalis ligni TaxID=2697027 RepID=A0A4R1NF17_9GAMM|nr:putative chitinase [Sodalis ligni]
MVLPTDGYSSASEFMSALQGTQGDAFWLLKSQGHWHGGLHLFDSFVPGAIYRPDGPAGHGLKSMTDGHIVAYRLNDDYRAAAHNKRALKFSTTFILVKSTCVPDKARPAHGLDFYTLWMQLAPLSVYGASDSVIGEVTATALKVRRDNPAPGWVRQGLPGGDGAQARTCYDVQNRYPAPRDTYTQLPRLSTVEILEEATFLLDRRAVPFVYVRVMSVPEGVSAGLAVGESGWISGQEKYLKRRGGAGALPRWMKAARQKGVFNEVVALAGDNVLPVSAGEIIGHLGYLESPHSAPHHFCHLEVFSQDSRLPDFVANRAGVTAGEPFIHSPRGKPRYFHRERDNTFEALAIGDDPVLTGEERFTPRSKTRWQKSGDNAWYEIPAERSWLAESDVTVVNQFDLAKRGFILLEQDEPPLTVRQTLREGWLRQGFQRLAALAQQNTRDMYSLTYIEGYQRLLKEMEFESDGEKFSKRLWQFLHNRQSHILKQVQRLIVKHHSEWLHDGMSALWRAALDEQGKHQPALALYNRQFIDALVWMKDVPEIRSSEALWHLHPVTFLEAISKGDANTCACNRDITLEELCAMAPNIKVTLLEINLQAFNEAFSLFGINTCIGKTHLLAQIFHESGGLIYTKEIAGESASYSPWYGRGLIQITLETNYKAYAKYINEDVFSTSTNRDKLMSLPHSVTSAAWFSKIHTKAAVFADLDDFNKITLTVNGGFNGYNDRLSFFKKGLESLKASHLIKLYKNEHYTFEESDIYNGKLGSLAWGIWHDPQSRRIGTSKNNNEALKGYLRAKYLIETNPLTQKEKERKWYGIIGENLSSFLDEKINKLNEVN